MIFEFLFREVGAVETGHHSVFMKVKSALDGCDSLESSPHNSIHLSNNARSHTGDECLVSLSGSAPGENDVSMEGNSGKCESAESLREGEKTVEQNSKKRAFCDDRPTGALFI